MSKYLKDALSDNAWSVSAVMFDLDDILDDEGRPISERRADAATRVGVEMDMKLCPFGGIRDGKWMNVSALAQINRYYKDALAEMTAFRRKANNENFTWEDVLGCIVEMMAGPATYLLQQRNPEIPVPAKVAVCHKLAAGMFGVLLNLHKRMALGEVFPVTTDSFIDLVEKTGALLGASEACAGSPKMIRKAVEGLMDGNAELEVELEPMRLDIARYLALQVQLGIFWHIYDTAHLWLTAIEFKPHMKPLNIFLQRKIDSSGVEFDENTPPPRPDSNMLPDALNPELRQQFIDALNDKAAPQALAQDKRAALELLTQQAGAILFNGDYDAFASSVANYLHAYRLFESELSRVELEMRQLLGFSADTPIRLGNAVFPKPQALYWYELVLGRKLGNDGRLSGDKIRVTRLTG